MDGSEDNSYLTLLNDGTQNYLLHSQEEVLGVPDTTLSVEPIFREIEDGTGSWSVGLPILNLISEAEESTVDLPAEKDVEEDNLPELYNESNSSLHQELISTDSNQLYPIQIPGKGFITSDGVFVSNDLLLQFRVEEGIGEEPAQNILIDPKTLTPHQKNSLAYLEVNGSSQSDSNSKDEIDMNAGIIELLNGDTVININNNLLTYASASKNDDTNIYRNFYEVVMAHKCKQCKYLCENQEEMILHIKKNHLEKNNAENDQHTVFLCSECNVGYNSTEQLKNHMISVHKLVGVGSTSKEPVSVESGRSLLKPQEKKTEELGKTKITAAIIKKQHRISKKIKCSIKGCDIRFARDELRKRHEQCHVEGQKKQFKCPECSIKFSIWRICSLHLWKCHKIDMGLLTCPMCHNFKTAAPVNLFHHMAIHEEERPFLCSHCGKTFKQASQLRNHQVSHSEPLSLPDWATQQQCDICKKYFANSKSLRKHIQCVHDKFKPFICNVCGHKTARKAMLELHLRQHTGEKPHKCPRCEYKTGDHNSLRRHMMRHSGAMKYSCPHCKYQSIQSTAYKKHIASKHPGLGGSYFCTLCSYHTVNENAYTSHMIDHRNGLIEHKTNQESNKMETIGSQTKYVQQQRLIYKVEDEETQNCFLTLETADETVDTGGITIPAGYELQVPF